MKTYYKLLLYILAINFVLIGSKNQLIFTNKSFAKLRVTLISTTNINKTLGLLLNKEEAHIFSFDCLGNEEIDAFQVSSIDNKVIDNPEIIKFPIGCTALEYTITKKLEINQRCDNFTKFLLKLAPS